ncbi:Tetratricopeptide repeat [Prochlorococcus marinus str. MIT 1342]|uniref:tetratricopeptide repeat protein n=1 Tax=Prochlorococcus TaxID=1218 RepID=UPI0007BB9CD8|nr:tetratricopeptide repeat protein [Prochlorococcus marinus]KZR80305.1 Tetratricopeptide repeat [Prochlorococcus marinus str. MIT 1342]
MIKPLSLIITASAVVISPFSAVAEIDAELHKLCIDAKDYKGCIEARTEPSSEVESNENEVEVSTPSTYNYEKDSVRQLKIRGKYGRYLTFIGRTANTYSGTSGSYSPGSGGTLNCSTYGSSTSTTTNCYRTGYVAPSYTPGRPGGTQHQRFRYELDCQDQTYNIKGDLSTAGGFKKGWMHVSNDPVASAVARKYCPVIDTLAVDQYNALDPKDAGHSIWKRRWGEEPKESISEQRYALVKNYFKQQQYNKVLKLSNQLVIDFPDDPRSWNVRGLAYKMLRNYSAAIENYSKAIYVNPLYEAAYDNRASSYAALGLFDKAIAGHSKAISLNPDYRIYWKNRGSSYWAKGDKRNSCRDRSKAIELGAKDSKFLKVFKKNCK